MNELFLKAKKIIKKIRQKKKVCLIHHDDADGNCSAALFSILIYNLVQDYPILFPVGGVEGVNRKLLSKIRKVGPDLVFVLDVSVEPEKLESFYGFILDHHMFSGKERGGRMIYLNPFTFEKNDEKIPPTSCMVYRILKDIFPREKVAWIAGIGITEDHRVELCRDVFEVIKKENPELLKSIKIDQESVERSLFGELWDMIRAGRMVKGSEGARTAVLALIECKDRPDKLVNGLTQHSSALRKFYEKVIYETQNCLAEVERKGRFIKEKKVIFFEQEKEKLRGLTSFLSDKIRQKYPEWIVCVINKEYGYKKSKISIRLEQKKRSEDLVSMLEKIKGSIPSLKGGGHKSAVGVIIDSEDIPEFEKRFLSLIK